MKRSHYYFGYVNYYYYLYTINVCIYDEKYYYYYYYYYYYLQAAMHSAQHAPVQPSRIARPLNVMPTVIRALSTREIQKWSAAHARLDTLLTLAKSANKMVKYSV